MNEGPKTPEHILRFRKRKSPEQTGKRAAVAAEPNIVRPEFPSVDVETDRYIKALELLPADAQTLRTVINQLGDKAFELPGLLIAVSCAIHNHLEPDYWKPNFEGYWARAMDNYDAFQKEMAAQGKKRDDITEEDARMAPFHSNASWMKRDREDILAMIAKEREHEASLRDTSEIIPFIKWAEERLTPELFHTFLSFLHIQNVEDESIVFDTQDAGELETEWKSLEKIGRYLSPMIREFISANPRFDPEHTRVIGNVGHKSKTAARAKSLREHLMAHQFIIQPDCPDDTFKELTMILLEQARKEVLSNMDDANKFMAVRYADAIQRISKKEELTKDERTRILSVLGFETNEWIPVEKPPLGKGED